ncbi:MAG: porin family protein, partial [Chitinophagales bacterium]
ADYLNAGKRKSQSRKILAITAALLFVGSSAGLYESLHHSKVSERKDERMNEKSVTISSPVSQYFAEDASQKKPDQTHFFKTNSIHSYPLPSEKKQADAQITFGSSSVEEKISVAETESSLQHMRISDVGKLHEDFSASPKSIPGNPVQAIQSLGNYYIGVAANFNSTWLLDKEALASNNLKYQFTFGGSYGLEGGYYFAKHWGFQAAWLINSWEGQKYKNLDIYGRTTSLDFEQKSISLTYMNVPLLIQYRSPHYSDLLNTSYNLDFIFGGQYGYLLTYRIDGEKGEVNSNQLFKHNEFAAVAGFDYDFKTDAPVFYTLGLRASIGTNIFNPGVSNYFEFSKPHNFIIGVHCAVNFGFRK